MAVTSGRVTTNKISKTTFYVTWQQTSQSTANNKTYIDWQAGINTGTSSSHDDYYSNAVKIKNIYINGSLVSNGGTWSNIHVGNDKQLLSGSAEIPHNSDGTKSFTISIEAWTYSSSNYSGSDTFTLTNIPRQAKVDTFNNFNDEANPVLTYTNSAGNNVSTLQACIASSDGNTIYAAYRDISKTGSSYTFNLTTTERNTLRNATPNSNTLSVKVYIKTILNGSTYYDSKSATMSIVNANPFIDTIDYADINSVTTDVSNDDHVIIQGMSRLQFQMWDVEALKGATLSTLSININGTWETTPFIGTSIVSTTYTYGEVDVSENVTAQLVLTDSRGNSSQYNVPLTIWAYDIPSAIITVNRDNNFYSSCKIKVDASYSSLDGNNTIDIQYRIKKVSDNSWGSWVSLSDNVQASFTADNQYAWDLQVQLEDILETTKLYTINKAIDVGIPIVFYDVVMRSVGVNCLPRNSGELAVNGVDVSNKYSTSETICGRWINDKPIYRKVVPITEIPSSQNPTIQVAHGISNLEDCTMLRGFYDNQGTKLLIPFVSDYYIGSQIALSINATHIVMLGSGNGGSVDGFVIVEYTKTTD